MALNSIAAANANVVGLRMMVVVTAFVVGVLFWQRHIVRISQQQQQLATRKMQHDKPYNARVIAAGLQRTRTRHGMKIRIVIRQPFPSWNAFRHRVMEAYRSELHSRLEQVSGTLEHVLKVSMSSRFYGDAHDAFVQTLHEKVVRLARVYELDCDTLEALFQPFNVDATHVSVDGALDVSILTNNTHNNQSFIRTSYKLTMHTNVTPSAEQRHRQDDFMPVRYRPPSSQQAASFDTSSYDSVAQIVAHVVRDWTRDGALIRQRTYDWCRYAALSYIRVASKTDTIVNILAPGAGLGRLAHDLALLQHDNNTYTYKVTALECSFTMTAAALSILQYHASGTLHPYASDEFINEVSDAARFKAVRFPDSVVEQTKLPLSWIVADFTSMMTTRQHYDAIVTCFFLDTATNLLDYLQTIVSLLVTGGVWINVGPLQWHSNSQVRVSVDELRVLVQAYGFYILHWSVDTEPMEYRSSVEQKTHSNAYYPLRFIVRKE
jgi:hypothetical protein